MSTAGRARGPQHAPGAPRVPFALLISALIGGSMCLLLALNTASAANEVRRHNLAVNDAAVADSLVQLNNAVNESAAPQNLAAAAAALGMVPADNPAFLVIGADGRVHLMGSPGAAKASAVHIASKPKPTPTKAASSSSTAASPTSSKPGSGKSSSGTAAGSTKPTSTPTPTPTPTPNTTLPGGPR